MHGSPTSITRDSVVCWPRNTEALSQKSQKLGIRLVVAHPARSSGFASEKRYSASAHPRHNIWACFTPSKGHDSGDGKKLMLMLSIRLVHLRKQDTSSRVEIARPKGPALQSCLCHLDCSPDRHLRKTTLRCCVVDIGSKQLEQRGTEATEGSSPFLGSTVDSEQSECVRSVQLAQAPAVLREQQTPPTISTNQSSIHLLCVVCPLLRWPKIHTQLVCWQHSRSVLANRTAQNIRK